MNERYDGTAVCTEEAAEAEVHTGDGTVKYIGTQIICAHAYDFLISGKKSDDGIRYDLAYDRKYCATYKNNNDTIAECLSCTFWRTCTDILCCDGRYRGQHGGWYQKYKSNNLFYYANACRDNKTASVGDYCYNDKGYLNQAVLKRYGNTDMEQLSDDGAVRYEILFGDMEPHVFFFAYK